MNSLTLHWHDAGQDKTQQIYEQQFSKNPGTVRLGRDPLKCDIVLTHPTVSGLHVEIFFSPQKHCFCIRNLRPTNPPVVNNQQLNQTETPLKEGSIIYLGQQQLQITKIIINSIPPTIITPPQQPRVNYQLPSAPPVQPQPIYALECPKCHKISAAENVQIGCPWCGTSLAAAISVLVVPNS
jgi:hypothetical protein